MARDLPDLDLRLPDIDLEPAPVTPVGIDPQPEPPRVSLPDIDVLGTSGLPGIEPPAVDQIADLGALPQVDLPVDVPADALPSLDLPDLSDLPDLQLDQPLALPDDLAAGFGDAPGFAEDIAGDITPQAPDNLDFGG